MRSSISAELLVLRKRTSTRILLALWMAMTAFFAYGLPYLTYRDATDPAEQLLFADVLPDALAANAASGFPFFGGVFALMLGVLSVGSEYGWGTLKTLFTQRPGRTQVFGAKLAALAITLVPFVLVVFLIGAVCSYVIAEIENATVDWPSAWLIVRAIAAGWLVLAVWTAFGVMLAVLSRGTALAIGVGVLYALAIEGLISAFAEQVSLLEPLVNFFLRANAYSLIKPLGINTEATGPGAFSGPFVDPLQAFGVLGAYLLVFAGVSAILLRRRDVT